MKSLLRYASFLRPDAALVAVLLAALAGGTGLGLVSPYVTGLMVGAVKDAVGVHLAGGAATGPGLGALPKLAAILLGATLGSGVLQFARGYVAEWLAQRSMFRARAAIFEHLEGQSFDYFDEAETGQILSRATGDVETIRRMVSRAAPGALSAVLRFFGTAAIMLTMDWRLALLTLAIAPVFMRVTTVMSRKMNPASWSLQQQLADLTTVLQENVASIRVVKAFARGPHEQGRFERENRAYFDRSMDVARITARYQPVMSQLPTLGTVFLLAYGGVQVIGGHLQFDMWVAFNTYVISLLGPLRIIGFFVTMASQAAASADRIFEILDSGGSVRQPPRAVVLPRLRGEVRLEKVWARYRRSEEWVLEDVDLHVRGGESVALVGMTGAGKSTLVQLLPRFYDPERGRVLLDGRDVRTADLRSLRSQIGFVLQDPFLFSASIADNIRYGRPAASLREVAAAARAAHIADFVESLPDGYGTTVGERGVGLSGGQKQRVAIARALVMDPRILVLDDATSSVDAESEHHIWEALRRLMEGRTSLLIAHRLASVMFASRIVVLEGGRIAATGTHAELLERSALYRNIYELQLAPRETAARHSGGLLA